LNLSEGQITDEPDDTDLRPDNSAGYLVRDTHLLFAKALRTRLQSHQITPGQWYFLRALWDEEGLSQRELSRRVGTTEPTTVSALRLLARSGMIERVRNPKDRRTINIYLTDKARDMKSELMPVAILLWDEIMENCVERLMGLRKFSQNTNTSSSKR